MEGIKKFYRRQAIDLIMFGHVNALINNLPFTVEKAILNFMKAHKLTEDDIGLEAFRTAYFRMQKELFETQRTNV